MVMSKTLRRKCKKCEEMFTPTGKYNFICPKCNPKNNSFWARLQRLSKENKKKRKKD